MDESITLVYNKIITRLKYYDSKTEYRISRIIKRRLQARI